MGLRSSIGVFGGMAVFFIGLIAVGMQADIVRPTAMNSSANGSSAAYNATRGVLEGGGAAAGQAVPIAGAAAFLLLSVGVLVAVYGGAR